MNAINERLHTEQQNLQEQRGENQRQDDNISKVVDEVNRQITDASQIAKMKQQTVRENDTKVKRLQHQVCTSEKITLPQYNLAQWSTKKS